MEILKRLGLHTDPTEKVYAAYDGGKLSLNDAVQLLADDFSAYHLKRIREEEIEENGPYPEILWYELLGAENHDGRSVDQMTSTGLALFSGVTTACVVAAECDQEVGVGMSHRNTISREYQVRIARRLLQNPSSRYSAGYRSNDLASHTKQARKHIPTGEIVAISKQTAREAMDEFDKLPSTEKAGKHKILVTGISYIEEDEKPIIARGVREVVTARRNPQLVHVDIQLGTIGKGIIYGAPQHPFFNKPRLVGESEFSELAMKIILANKIKGALQR